MKLAPFAALAGCAMALPASAATTIYNSRAAFNAAVGGGLATESFEASRTTNATLSYTGFTVSETNGDNAIAYSGAVSLVPAALSDGSFYINYDDNGASLLVFNFNSAINSFGFNIAFNEAQTAAIIVGGVTIGSITLPANTGGFFGARSDTAFTQFTVDVTGGPNVGVDQLTFGTAAVVSGVPEPSTWALMIGGFGMVGACMRRRTKMAARIRFA